MIFDSETLLKVENIDLINYDFLLSIHDKNVSIIETFCKSLSEAAVNKTQKTKAKKQIKDIKFKLKYNQDKEMREWISKHPEHDIESNLGSDDDDDDDVEDISPEALLKHIDLSDHETKKKSEANSVENVQKDNAEEFKVKRNRQKERKLRKQQELEKLKLEAAKEAALLPDLKKIEADALLIKCKELGLKQQEIRADGHCLYYSILDQLTQRHLPNMFSSYSIPKSFKFFDKPEDFYGNLNVELLRQLNVSYLKENKEVYEFLLFDDNSSKLMDFDNYCDKMENTAAWGGEIELSVFSKIFNCQIFIMQQDTHYSIGDDEEAKNPEFKLVYYKHTFTLGAHYGSLRDEK